MRKTYSKKDIKQFIAEYSFMEPFMDKKSLVVQEDNKLFIDNKLCFRLFEQKWVPSLELLREKSVLPKVVVDKGAPPFILKGADLMRPGVVSCEYFEKDTLVVLVDEQHKFPLATGKALVSSESLLAADSGKVVKIIHNLKTE